MKNTSTATTIIRSLNLGKMRVVFTPPLEFVWNYDKEGEIWECVNTAIPMHITSDSPKSEAIVEEFKFLWAEYLERNPRSLSPDGRAMRRRLQKFFSGNNAKVEFLI